MSEEKEVNPQFVFKDNLPLMREGKKIKLDCAEPIATGEGKFGTWNLWVGFVDNAKVVEGRGATAKTIEDYSGKVIFFPPEKLNEKLVEIAAGNIGVEVLVKRIAEEGRRGFITKYPVEKLSEGEKSNNGLTPTEAKLVDDAQKLINEGHEITESVLITASKEPTYEGKISEARAKELYALLK